MRRPTRRETLALCLLPAALVLLGLALRQPTFGGRAARPPAGADAARLKRDVKRLAVDMTPRDWLSLKNLDRAAVFIAAELKAAGGRVERQEYRFTEFDAANHRVTRGPYANILARFGPAGGNAVVVGAHYDVYGSFPGADDNASGVAALLELARLLGKNRPAVPVELVAYTLEEPPHFAGPHMGSLHHAIELFKREERVRAMISLETMGYFSDEPGSQEFPIPLLKLFYPSTGNFIAVAGRFSDAALARKIKKAMRAASDLPVYSISAPAMLPGIDFSDHRSYWKAGYPGVMVSDTAFYRNRRYHTPADTPETLDYPRMAKVVEGVYSAVQSFKP